MAKISRKSFSCDKDQQEEFQLWQRSAEGVSVVTKISRKSFSCDKDQQEEFQLWQK